MHRKYAIFLIITIGSLGCIGWHCWHYKKSVVVIIPSYNNAEWYDKNLSSVFAQDYQNYKVVYMDDNSDDDTYKLVVNKTW
jgi:cellulose synthase/poly-beta-1,6-N-acetylglucosamine synthase-like glycosyltransferase